MIIGSAAKCRICMRQHATTTSHNKVVRSKLCCSHCKREWHPIERAYNKFPRHDDRSTHPISAPPKTNLIIYISFCLTAVLLLLLLLRAFICILGLVLLSTLNAPPLPIRARTQNTATTKRTTANEILANISGIHKDNGCQKEYFTIYPKSGIKWMKTK